ncbi:MAG TPA: hypothetical protein PLO33_03405, partial [Kouleothrix sp.]|nr:hypothetical protein [Kouleothrix sp.]
FVITADGPEAEIATPPVPITRGFTRQAAAWASEARACLAARLPGWAAGRSTRCSATAGWRW